MLATAVAHTAGPIAVRYPRGAGVGVATDEPLHTLPVGKAETLLEGDDVLLLAAGTMVLPAERAADLLAREGIEASVVNARFVKPLDDDLILRLARRCRAVVTVEESAAMGGFGAGVLELLAREGVQTPTKVLGIPDRVFEQASQVRLRELAGLTAHDIAATAKTMLAKTSGVQRPRAATTTAQPVLADAGA
jgi:1-deoxy-D-xylulose-5-phosphate synthase